MIRWINVLKGICALLVVVAHSQKPAFLSVLLVPAFLSGFFFASGYTYRGKEKYVLKECLKTVKIMLEITIVETILMELIYATVWSTQWEVWVSVPFFIRVKNFFCDLWFFPCMLMAKIIFHFIHKISNKVFSMVLIVCLSVLGGVFGCFTLVGKQKKLFGTFQLPCLCRY